MRLSRILLLLLFFLPLVLLGACSGGEGTGQGEPEASASSFPGESITVGLPDDLPGFGVGTNPSVGFDANLAQIVAQGLDKPMTPTNLKAAQRDGALLGTAEKQVQLVVAAYSIVPARVAKGLVFAGPYLKTPQSFLVRADDPTEWSRESIVTKDVCAIAGTTGKEAHFPEGTNITTQTFMRQCVDLLVNKKVDAVFDDEVILWGHQRDSGGDLTVKSIESIGNQQYYGIGMIAANAGQCAEISDLVKNYMRSTQWRIDFRAYIPEAEQAYLSDEEDFETTFKPTLDEVNSFSCQTQIG